MSDTDTATLETGRILLVEDNPNEEALILRSLAKAGLGERVDVTRDGEQALDYLFATGAHGQGDGACLPAVIFLDLHMPKLNGFEVLKQLRSNERTRTVPVVVLTSSDVEEDKLTSYRLGANSYICKPISYAEFTAAIRQAALYWVQLNQLPTKGYQVP